MVFWSPSDDQRACRRRERDTRRTFHEQTAGGHAMTTARTVPGLPFTLSPSPGGAWTIDEANATVTVTAAAHSDIFIDPGANSQLNAESMLNAATLLGVPPDGDFQFSARVTVDFGSTFDAGVLLLWIDDRHWGKLCFEYSPDGEPMIVSVVARGVADDANAFVVDGRTVWLRVSRIDRAFAYHASLDGRTWRMIRFFAIDDTATPASIGFEAQSPTGNGCVVTFDDIQFTGQRLHELRDGS
jgi:regulation of enolase protein 1 (concanavalin A-like superfamily)